jgi:hypothetical protein
MNKYNFVSIFLALVVILFIPVGCSKEDSSNNFHKLLGLIPSDSYYAEYPMTLFNHASYIEDKNISFVKPNGELMTMRELFEVIGDDQVGRYTQYGFDITGWGRYALEAGLINDKRVGYNFSCVDVEIEVGAPPYNIVAAVGRFNPQATKYALSNQEDWMPSTQERYMIEEYNDVTIHSWGGMDLK